jgi:hydrogenase large subunit
MSKRITIDPITRIEGHLRIDVEVDRGEIRDSWSSGQMWRGVENILQGRDPRDAWVFTQRFCGVCTTVHAITSVRAVENALGLEVPLNAQYIRNLILIAHALHDHIVHFYHLSALDWVDVVSALDADPAATAKLAESISPWPNNSRRELAAVKERLVKLVGSGQLGIFAGGYWGHPAMKLSPEVNLLAVSHYLQALEYQRKANQIVAILGGKTPNIQNLQVGGVANAINLDDQSALNMEKLYHVKTLFDEVTAFVQQVYFLDVATIGAMYPEWLGYGDGVTNYLAVPDLPLDTKGELCDLPGGTLMNADLGSLEAITRFGDDRFRDNVAECIAHSWYDGDWTRHPYEETTEPSYSEFQDKGKYSWVKSPRFGGEPMQVGPLAHVLVAFASGHEPTRRWAMAALEHASKVAGTKLGPAVLHSTLGRHLGRTIRAAVLSELAPKHWSLLVENIGRGDTEIFNTPEFPTGEIRGFGFHEAPRGALSHWAVIANGKIANYQAVVPSTWNAGPRDDRNRPGPYEASLIGNPVADAELPLEVLRTIHSFDPCLACAIHTADPEGRELSRVTTVC